MHKSYLNFQKLHQKIPPNYFLIDKIRKMFTESFQLKALKMFTVSNKILTRFQFIPNSNNYSNYSFQFRNQRWSISSRTSWIERHCWIRKQSFGHSWIIFFRCRWWPNLHCYLHRWRERFPTLSPSYPIPVNPFLAK